MNDKYFSGPLLKEILKHLQAFNDGQDTRRAYLYSAHDITLVNLLRTMGFTDEYFKPDYGSTVIFELHAASNSANTEIKVYIIFSLSFPSFPFSDFSSFLSLFLVFTLL